MMLLLFGGDAFSRLETVFAPAESVPVSGRLNRSGTDAGASGYGRLGEDLVAGIAAVDDD